QYKSLRKSRQVTDCRLEVHPLVAFRDYHNTAHENGSINAHVETTEGMALVQPYADAPTLYFAHDANELGVTGYWYRNFEYSVERERGLDFTEDLFNHFVLRFDLNQTATATVIASTEPHAADEADKFRETEVNRREKLLAGVDGN